MKLINRIIPLLIALSMILAACAPSVTPTSEPVVEPSPAVEEPTAVAPTAVVEPRSLTVCLGQEPNTFYPLDNPNQAARAVLSAIYDGPIDEFIKGEQPVILSAIPSALNGDAQVTPVKVNRGQQVIDSSGKPALLDLGTSVLPSGCYDDNCAVVYDGRSEIVMDQLIVTFRMLPDLKWSDGQPLTSDDSLYAYELASNPQTPGSKYLVDRTQSYEVLDQTSLQWWGKPGFIDPSYEDNFWMPLPRHAWSSINPLDLAKADVAARPALGWGPYVFDEYVAGQFVKLSRNPTYFRAEYGLPRMDFLVFRFLKDAESGIAALADGQCDVLDSSLRIDGQLELLSEMERNEQIKLSVATSPLIERLDFGMNPAAYDDGFNILLGDRPDFFADVRTRQAFAYCLDREKINTQVLLGYSSIPTSYLPASTPLDTSSAALYPFDPQKGAGLLTDAGWIDDDGNPATPRKAQTVTGVPPGTPFVISYSTTSALQRRQVSEILVESLAQCGIQANPQFYTPEEFYAAGPVGLLFGRKFDLAVYAIGSSDSQPPCAWFTSEQVPTAANKWVGVNVMGYENADFDLLCRRAGRLTRDNPLYAETHSQLLELFTNDLPSIPLYYRLKVAATRPDMCNFGMDASALNDYWNIEEFDYGAPCN
jgi:peptide/nickel transport system substrate-binding protein